MKEFIIVVMNNGTSCTTMDSGAYFDPNWEGPSTDWISYIHSRMKAHDDDTIRAVTICLAKEMAEKSNGCVDGSYLIEIHDDNTIHCVAKVQPTVKLMLTQTNMDGEILSVTEPNTVKSGDA
jgi:hypothetical protein